MLRILRSSKQNSLTDALFACIKEDLDARKSVVLVVPAQTTLLTEQKAFSAFKAEGFFNLDIVSGQKLHELILGGTARPSETPVNTIGRSMLLRKLALDLKDSFKVFSSVLKEPGFIDIAADFIVQLKRNTADDAALDGIIDGCKDGSLLKNKLSDMKLLCDAYQAAMAGRFTDSEDLLSFVTNRVKESDYIRNSRIYFHGFYSFTERELVYLSELERCSQGLFVSLLSGSEDCFAVTRKTEKRLLTAMPSELIEIEAGVSFAPETHVVRCANPYTQAETIAADIRRLVREKGYSYGDFAVLFDGLESSKNILKRVLSSANVPLFADEKRSILHSSAIEAISSLMDCAAYDFRTTDIIRFCKSGVLSIEQTLSEDFEIYLKLYHIKGDKLHKPFKYGKEKLGEELFERLEALRAELSSRTLSFAKSFNEALSAKDKTLVLYNFLDSELKLWDFLERLSEKQAEEGFLDAAEESAQLWDIIIGVFEQCAELLGAAEMSSEDYAKLIESAFADIRLGVLPQAEGRVQLGTVARSFTEGAKVLYIAGFNQGSIPSDADTSGILTEDEQASLEKAGVHISQSSDLIYEEECYMLHKAMSSAPDYLWLGYYVSGEYGDDAKISPLLADFCKDKEIAAEDDISSDSSSLLPFEGSNLAIPHLSTQLRAAMNGAELSSIWKQAYNILKDRAPALKAGLRFSSKLKPLGKDKARQLFAGGGDYSLSPSRMNGFAACPFKHFVNYGLRPKELTEFGIKGSEIGSFNHEALLHLCNALSEPARRGGFAITDPRSLWMTADEELLESMLEAAMKQALESKELDGVMDSGAEALYRSDRVKKVCLRFAKHMVDQVRHSVISEMYFEAAFGRRGVFPPIEISTAAGKVFVEGKIDRVDVQKRDGNKHIRIIDYKSGNTKFSKALIEQGVQLQLMVYLEGALGDFPKKSSGGIYYFNIKNPVIETGIEELSASKMAEELIEKINKEYKLDGMEVEEEFKVQFMNTLSGLCEKLALGEISAEPKKFGSSFDSCEYCEYSGICQKDIK